MNKYNKTTDWHQTSPSHKNVEQAVAQELHMQTLTMVYLSMSYLDTVYDDFIIHSEGPSYQFEMPGTVLRLTYQALRMFI